jgi:putative ABC transport system permease protein
MNARATSRSERVLRLLLHVYPASFRDGYAEDVVELFLDRSREVRSRHGWPGLAWLWARTVPGMIVHGLLERLSQPTRSGASNRGASIRTAMRSLVRSPALTAVIVSTLGVGIGANVALYSVLRGVLLKPLPYPDADRLVRLWETNPDIDGALHGPSPLNFADWAREPVGIESMAAWYLTSGTYRTDLWMEEIRSAQVTVDFFRVLGVQPMHGRDFRPEEVVRYGPVMLSHRLWVRRFGSDPGVVGRTIASSNLTYKIVGVMPPGFAFPDESVEAWIAWDLDAVYADRPEARTWRFLDGVGRLASGTSIPEAEAQLDAVAQGLAERHPIMDRGWDAAVTSLHEETVGDVRATLWIAFGAVLFIPLIACANVANLLLARVPARSRELAIRATLGATRGRIARDLLAEDLLLGLASGVVGLALGQAFLSVLVALDAGRIPRLDDVRIDASVLAFAVVMAGLTSVVFGLVPAAQTLRASVGAPLRDGTRTTATRMQRRVREAFVASQVAVTLVLLTGAGLFASSLAAVLDVDPGVEPANVATFRVSLDPVDGSEEEIVRYYEGLLERLADVPGVVRVGASQTLPFSPVGNDFRRPFRAAGSGIESADAPAVQMRITTPGYAEAIGMRLIEGSPLPESASLGEPLVALVNQTLALRLWPDRSPVGETIEVDFREGWEPYTVVGVVRDVKHYGLREAALPEIFLSHRQVPYLAMSLVARTVGDPALMTETLRSVVLSHQPMQPAHNFVSLADLMSSSTAEERFLSVLLALFAGIALALATTGVYGVIAFSVSHRRREIGVRMALGADAHRVVGGVLLGAVSMAVVGVAVGTGIVTLLARPIEGMLFGVSGDDPGTKLLVGAVLLTVSVVAAWVPARRAARVAPSEALSAE